MLVDITASSWTWGCWWCRRWWCRRRSRGVGGGGVGGGGVGGDGVGGVGGVGPEGQFLAQLATHALYADGSVGHCAMHLARVPPGHDGGVGGAGVVGGAGGVGVGPPH